MPSYLYFVDSRLPHAQKIEERLVELEKNIVELGIAGPVIRLNPLKTIQDTLASRNFQNTQTVVGIGGDELFFDLIDFVCEKPLTLGMIVFSPAAILKHLGVPEGLNGCRIIAQRITQSIRCGKINQKYFFSDVLIPFSYQVNLDGRFDLSADSSLNPADMFMRAVNIDFKASLAHPAGRLKLEAIKRSKKFLIGEVSEIQSSFEFSELRIKGQGDEPIVADGQKAFKPPVEITFAPSALKMIVGKNRHPFFQ